VYQETFLRAFRSLPGFRGPLVLDDDEWLMIAARANVPSNPVMTGDSDVRTLMLRVTGGGLNAFHAGRLTGEQLRSRVQVGEF
jgi:hypothetical protein